MDNEIMDDTTPTIRPEPSTPPPHPSDDGTSPVPDVSLRHEPKKPLELEDIDLAELKKQQAKVSLSEEISQSESLPHTVGAQTPSIQAQVDEALGTRSKNLESAIRTYESDIAETIKTQKASLASIALSEQRRRGLQPQEPTPAPTTHFWSKTRTMLISIVALVLIAGGAGILFFVSQLTTEDIPPVIANRETFFSANETREVPLTTQDRIGFSRLLGTAIANTALPLGQVTELVVTQGSGETQNIITAKTFLDRLETETGGPFERSLASTFMLGVHSFDSNQPFIVFRVTSFDGAFAGMLEWEDTMVSDLAFLNGEEILSPLAFGVQQQFRDRVVRNKDVRELRAENGETQLMYSFPDDETLVITTNEQTLIEVFDRLTRAELGIR